MSVPNVECGFVLDTECTKVPQIQCNVIQEEVCQTQYISPIPSYGAPAQNCRQVPRGICEEVLVDNCVQTEREECGDVTENVSNVKQSQPISA